MVAQSQWTHLVANKAGFLFVEIDMIADFLELVPFVRFIKTATVY